jgi:5-oxoprolinase (ATP-hydrolysing)
VLPELVRVAEALEAGARAELERDGVPGSGIRRVRRAHLRYEGTDTALPVPMGGLGEMVRSFEEAYRQRFSFLMRDKAIAVEAVSVELTGPPEPLADAPGEIAPRPPAAEPHPAGRVPMFFSGSWAEVDLFRRVDLRPGHMARGPAIIVEDFATTVVEPGWQAAVTGRSDLLLTRAVTRTATSSPTPRTSRCTSGRWARASRSSCSAMPVTSGTVMSTR